MLCRLCRKLIVDMRISGSTLRPFTIPDDNAINDGRTAACNMCRKHSRRCIKEENGRCQRCQNFRCERFGFRKGYHHRHDAEGYLKIGRNSAEMEEQAEALTNELLNKDRNDETFVLQDIPENCIIRNGSMYRNKHLESSSAAASLVDRADSNLSMLSSDSDTSDFSSTVYTKLRQNPNSNSSKSYNGAYADDQELVKLLEACLSLPPCSPSSSGI